MEGIMPSRKKRSSACKNSMAHGCVTRPAQAALGWEGGMRWRPALRLWREFGATYIAVRIAFVGLAMAMIPAVGSTS
jgi:hypothetical protein